MDQNIVDQIKEIDDHLQHHSQKEVAQPSGEMSLEAQKIFSICGVWTKAAPIVKFAAKFLLFWKPSWVSVVNDFVSALDASCAIPQQK